MPTGSSQISLTDRDARWAEEKRVFAEMIARHQIELEMKYPLSDCPLGWSAIVDELLRDLAALGCRQIEQLKSKFGGLRVYLPRGAHPEAEALIERTA